MEMERSPPVGGLTAAGCSDVSKEDLGDEADAVVVAGEGGGQRAEEVGAGLRGTTHEAWSPPTPGGG